MHFLARSDRAGRDGVMKTDDPRPALPAPRGEESHNLGWGGWEGLAKRLPCPVLASQLPVCPSFRLLACYFSVSLPLLSHLPLRTLPLSASQSPDNSRRPLCFSSGGPPGLAVLRGAASSHTCQQCIDCPCVVALTATYKQGGKNLESHFPLIHLPFVICPFLPSFHIHIKDKVSCNLVSNPQSPG